MPIVQPPTEIQNTIVFDLETTDLVKDLKVNEPIEVIPLTEVSEQGIVRYSLEEYMEIEEDLMNSKPLAKVAEPQQESLSITLKDVPEFKSASQPDTLDPTEMSIEEILKMRADERRRKLKESNYKFHNSVSRIEELEKEPAYKRVGIELNAPIQNQQQSRMSLGTDSNDDIQLRSNNSFLHDNVD
jgi:cell division protein FtsZ